LDAIKLGGFTGRGMGEGILKENVPEAHTDYVIAIISEEYGSIVSILITSIFLYISFRIIKNCFNQDDVFLKISLCGLATLLIFQMFIHAGVNTNLIPATGMTLPFLSYGGSSLIGSAILAGIILNYSKSKGPLHMIKRKKIVIATGGTGGHVFPAYSLASYLLKNNYNVNITIDEKRIKIS
jgi:cell division protein FtsW